MTFPYQAEYNFLAPRQIVFGWGRRSEVGRIARTLGGRALLVTGSQWLGETGVDRQISGLLQQAGVSVQWVAAATREPTVADVDAAVANVRSLPIQPGDFVVAIGGGSTLDLGKAVAALATNPQGDSVREFLEGVGSGLTIDHPPLPLLAMPTTAGTGSEATKNSVISGENPAFKKSLRSDAMVPAAVVVDPELTVSLPPAVTAHTGMDALTQLIESFLSRRAQPIPTALCRQGIALAFNHLATAVEDGASRRAREAMSHAALLSGLALANSGLGLAHGVAAALGIQHGVPHGLACAVMLPTAIRVNASVCPEEMIDLAAILGHREDRDARAAAEFVHESLQRLGRRIGIPTGLGELGVTPAHLPKLVTGSRGNSMNGNPRNLSDEQLLAVLEGCL